MLKNFLNPKGHQNPTNGSKVTAILLKGWLLPIGGAWCTSDKGAHSYTFPKFFIYSKLIEARDTRFGSFSTKYYKDYQKKEGCGLNKAVYKEPSLPAIEVVLYVVYNIIIIII